MPDVYDIVASPPQVDRSEPRDEDVVLSRSRRSKIGGTVTTVYLTPMDNYIVECKHGQRETAGSFAAAMRLARLRIASSCPYCSRIANGNKANGGMEE